MYNAIPRWDDKQAYHSSKKVYSIFCNKIFHFVDYKLQFYIFELRPQI